MRRFTIILLTLLMVTLPLSSKGDIEKLDAPIRKTLSERNTFVVGIDKGSDTPFLNPVEATDTNSLLILEGLFEGLFNFDGESGMAVGAIAKEFELSSDQLTWTFYLDENSRFSNGDPIDSSTFIESWFWLLDNPNGKSSPLIAMMGPITNLENYRNGSVSKNQVGIKALDKYTIQLTLNYSAPYLPSLLATIPFSAIHKSFRTNKNEQLLISSGPFVLVENNPTQIVLEKNSWYRAYDEVGSDYIKFLFLDEQQLIESYQNNLIDWSLAFVPPQYLKSLNDLHIDLEYSTAFYYFSSTSGPYANKEIRKALSLLIPWDELKEESGQLFPTTNLIPKEKIFSYSYETNKEKAFEILSKEGFSHGIALPELNIGVHRGSKVYESAKKIADIWSQELGITVILDVVPLKMYSRYPSQSPYDFAFITWIGDILDPFSFLSLFLSDSGYNLANYKDSTYDELVYKAMESGSQNLIEQAELYLLDNSVVFPFYHGFTINIVNSEKVAFWHDNLLNIHPLKELKLK